MFQILIFKLPNPLIQPIRHLMVKAGETRKSLLQAEQKAEKTGEGIHDQKNRRIWMSYSGDEKAIYHYNYLLVGLL